MTLASGVELWIAPCAYGPAPHLTLTIFDIRRGHFPNTAKLTANLCSVLTELRAAWSDSKEKWLALNTGPGPSGGAAGGHLRPRPLSARPRHVLAISRLTRPIPLCWAVKCNSCSHPKLNLKFEVSSPPQRRDATNIILFIL